MEVIDYTCPYSSILPSLSFTGNAGDITRYTSPSAWFFSASPVEAGSRGAWTDRLETGEGAKRDRLQTERRIAMKKLVRSVITALMMITLTVGLSGCTKEGPVEKAGKKVDKAIEKAGEQIEKAGEKVQDAVQDAKK